MASNISKFLSDTNAEIKKLQEKQVKEAKVIVLTAYSQILDLSPVDTSLFKHNHIITVNSKTSKTKDISDNTSQNKSNINTAKFKHNDNITIQNNLKYGNALESGHSHQAPAGVYGITEERMRKVINKRTKI